MISESDKRAIAIHCERQAKRLSLLAAQGFAPRVIYDIGAFHGDWSHAVQKVFPNTQFYLFEANEDNKSVLSKKPFHYYIELLGDVEKEECFYCKTTPCTGESIFLEQSKFFQSAVIKRMCRMRTLASVVKKHNLPLPDLIKIDVQGAEILVVKGSPEVICAAEAVILEANILEYNKGAPLIHETINVMHSLGFRVIDILDGRYLQSGALFELDILFVKFDSRYIKKVFD